MHRWVLMATLALALPRTQLLAQADRLVVLVRHAEAAGEPQADPPLTNRGAERARALAYALAAADLGAVIVSDRQRTRLTAQVVLDDLGLTPSVVGIAGGLAAHVGAAAEAVRALSPAKSVLVVGHGNTVPAIIAALGGPPLEDLCHGEYARLFLLLLRADGTTAFIETSYGTSDEEHAGACHAAAP